ncbi:MAG: hypothetical protein JF608_03535 [Sphingomonadales bacterium]|nr:hypothetical protein [Sphingomonadales bacterium]
MAHAADQIDRESGFPALLHELSVRTFAESEYGAWLDRLAYFPLPNGRRIRRSNPVPLADKSAAGAPFSALSFALRLHGGFARAEVDERVSEKTICAWDAILADQVKLKGRRSKNINEAIG